MSERVLLAFGGNSPEHEVSVITAMQAASALKETLKYELIPLYLSKEGTWFTGQQLLNLESYQNIDTLKSASTPCYLSFDAYGRAVLKENKATGFFSKPKEWPIQVVLAAFHGSEGENGAFQGLCEQFYLPYTGSGVLASSLGMNKAMAKNLASTVGVPVVPGVTFNEKDWVASANSIKNQIVALGLPVILKPMSLGSSIGIFRIQAEDEISSAIEQAFQFDFDLIAEKMITPLTEINCSVLSTANGHEVSVCEQPKALDAVLTFEDKYLSDSRSKGMASAQRLIPAPISDQLRDRIQNYALKIAKGMDLGGVARLDFLVQSETEEAYFNEVNTIPGSFSFYLWKHNGISFSELMERLIQDAYQRHARKTGRMRHHETNLLSKRAATGLKGLKSKA